MFSSQSDLDDLFALIPTQVFQPDASPRKSDSDSSGTLVTASSSSTLGKRSTPVIDSLRPVKTLKRRHEDDGDPFIGKPSVSNKPSTIDSKEPYIIVHSSIHQSCFEARKIPYGAQYEIARLVSMGHISFTDIIMENLDKLSSLSNAEGAPQARRIVRGNQHTREEKPNQLFERETQAKSPWKELDKEEAAFCRYGDNGSLGFANCADTDWFGGKVIFRAALKNKGTANNPIFTVTLGQAELGPSCRFSRRFGSKSFLRIKIGKSLWMNESTCSPLLDFLKKPFVLLGSVYRTFYAKDGTAFLFRTHEVPVETKAGLSILQTHILSRPSLLDFLEWHNPLELNAGQPISKWSSRIQLGLSTSVPGLMLQEDDILQLEDIVSDSGSDMTDGAGLINKSALSLLYQKFQWDSWPTAVQVRVKGSKGLLVQHLDDVDPTPKVWLRPSQVKIKYPPTAKDDAYRVVDVLRSSHSRPSCRLSIETIINLSANGVPNKAFRKLLRQSLDSLVESFTKWDDQDDLFRLWRTVSHIGRVFSIRSARFNAPLARLHGHAEGKKDSFDSGSESENEDVTDDEKSLAWWPDEASGCPSGLEETTLYILDAGFWPQDCSMLRDKVDKLLRRTIDNYASTFRLEVGMACTAFLTPDETGCLEPGELYYKSSRCNLLTPDGGKTDMILGDVLLTRNPCKLPTDVQKWKAVDKPELRGYTDVIVLSTKGERRAADYLAGGDYDGDKGTMLYDPILVKPFVNADPESSKPPPDIHDNFISRDSQGTISELLERRQTGDNIVEELQSYLLANLGDSVVGEYSNLHTQAIYTLGYSHPEVVRLAHLFCMTLDGAKTGLKVKPEVLNADRKKYGQGVLPWKGQTDTTKNQRTLQRPQRLGTFVMDSLASHAKKESDRVKANLDKRFDQYRHEQDKDLVRPWLDAQRLASRWKTEGGSERMEKDLSMIASHVERMFNKHREALNIGSPRKSPTKGGQATFSELPIEKRQDTLRKLSREFISFPTPDDVLIDESMIRTYRASYAYYYDWEARQRCHPPWTGFPWHCAMRELCEIKAKATGRWKTVDGDFYARFSLKAL